MNGQRSHVLVGYVNPTGIMPSFVIPIFSNEQGFCVQDGVRGSPVGGFAPCDLDLDLELESGSDRFRLASITRSVEVGQAPLFAFQFKDKTIVCGNDHVVRAALQERRDEIRDHLFVYMDTCEFLGDANELARVLQEIRQKLPDSRCRLETAYEKRGRGIVDESSQEYLPGTLVAHQQFGTGVVMNYTYNRTVSVLFNARERRVPSDSLQQHPHVPETNQQVRHQPSPLLNEKDSDATALLVRKIHIVLQKMQDSNRIVYGRSVRWLLLASVGLVGGSGAVLYLNRQLFGSTLSFGILLCSCIIILVSWAVHAWVWSNKHEQLAAYFESLLCFSSGLLPQALSYLNERQLKSYDLSTVMEGWLLLKAAEFVQLNKGRTTEEQWSFTRSGSKTLLNTLYSARATAGKYIGKFLRLPKDIDTAEITFGPEVAIALYSMVILFTLVCLRVSNMNKGIMEFGFPSGVNSVNVIDWLIRVAAGVFGATVPVCFGVRWRKYGWLIRVWAGYITIVIIDLLIDYLPTY